MRTFCSPVFLNSFIRRQWWYYENYVQSLERNISREKLAVSQLMFSRRIRHVKVFSSKSNHFTQRNSSGHLKCSYLRRSDVKYAFSSWFFTQKTFFYFVDRTTLFRLTKPHLLVGWRRVLGRTIWSTIDNRVRRLIIRTLDFLAFLLPLFHCVRKVWSS